MIAEPQEAPEPVEPGSLASAPIDKLLVEWRALGNSDLTALSADDVAAYAVAYILDEGRTAGHDVREWITALGKRLTEAAGALGSAPFGDREIDAFLKTVPETPSV